MFAGENAETDASRMFSRRRSTCLVAVLAGARAGWSDIPDKEVRRR